MEPPADARPRRLRGQRNPGPEHPEPLPAQREAGVVHAARADAGAALPRDADVGEDRGAGADPQRPPAFGLCHL